MFSYNNFTAITVKYFNPYSAITSTADDILNLLLLIFTESKTFYVVILFCVEVLRPSQPNGGMLSAVSLPNHTFTGQA